MPSRRVRITAHNGAHARPVAELARLAIAHADPITLTTSGGVVVDLSSILAVMDLALTEGDEVVLETRTSAGAETLLDTMAAVLAPPR
ncbi:HPr family phosphocarrier protein [Microbacterium sp. SD291]|uniref:HPr family phosphocarrier protein n=1 Tax=Microbacterium sp. SD291 TaxID=2782007 RepID=UPI001A975BF1|nr:HPr family phosphocarrier protein [Microbacterium sp. SD291]MBO0981071.1 HPr family phosphocarrier protein [Microbacterium sp. SD291]